MVPFIRPFRWSRLIWTYLIPLNPIVLFLDGIVSCLRAYSPLELSELTRELSASGYIWEIGEERRRLLSPDYVFDRVPEFRRGPADSRIGCQDRVRSARRLDSVHGFRGRKLSV